MGPKPFPKESLFKQIMADFIICVFQFSFLFILPAFFIFLFEIPYGQLFHCPNFIHPGTCRALGATTNLGLRSLLFCLCLPLSIAREMGRSFGQSQLLCAFCAVVSFLES
jgi:hypothetical protein